MVHAIRKPIFGWEEGEHGLSPISEATLVPPPLQQKLSHRRLCAPGAALTRHGAAAFTELGRRERIRDGRADTKIDEEDEEASEAKRKSGGKKEKKKEPRNLKRTNTHVAD